MPETIKQTQLMQALSPEQQRIVEAIYSHSITLLDNSHRFKFFTLHGRQHTQSLFKISDILISGGIKLQKEECFLLALSLCIHDLGMVMSLHDWEQTKIFDGYPVIADPAMVEEYIRETHHDLVEIYFKNNNAFLAAAGLSPTQLSQVLEISRCHRKVDLEARSGFIRYLGALMRLIDELDISSSRAPIAVLTSRWRDMDPTSIWHWFKHNIVENWQVGHNVHYSEYDGRKGIEFELIVHPSRNESVPYWLNQIRRPITRVLIDDGCHKIITDKFGVSVTIKTVETRSTSISLNNEWAIMEDMALSSGRKLILVADDEYRKLSELFLPLMDRYHVTFSANAKDALQKQAAKSADLAIIDMQIGSGFIWSEAETADYKNTGVRLSEEIMKLYPNTKVGFLTGTKHSINGLDKSKLAFFIRKPVDPDILRKKVENVLDK